MKSQFILEFSNGVIQGTLPGTDDPGGLETGGVIIWESPRLSVATPYPNREKGADRSICRTVNGQIQIKIVDKSILNYPARYDGEFTKPPLITAGLYGESAGIIGAIDIDQSREFNPALFNALRYTSNGDKAFKIFRSYANLMQNIFIRVTITRADAQDSGVYLYKNPPLPIKMVCSGVLIGADPR